MTRTQKIWWVISGLVLILGAAYLINTQSAENDSRDAEIYRNSQHAFEFRYPKGYYLEEKNTGNSERYRYSVILTEDTETNRQIREGQNEVPTEGPTAITIDVYQNNLDRQPAENWIKNSNESNYKLIVGNLSSTTLAGQPALTYVWDGLYRGETIVFSNEKNVYALSVTYLGTEDKIRKDFFETIVPTFKLGNVR